MENSNIVADMVEATEFPELAERYRVFAVPKIVINESVSFEGALPDHLFALYVLKAVDRLNPECTRVRRVGPRTARNDGKNTSTITNVVERTGTRERIPVAGVFIYLLGTHPITNFLNGQVELTPKGCIKVNPETKMTNVPGVFAVGDVVCKEIRQAVIAAAEGAIAALEADKFLRRHSKARSDWA